MTVYILGAGPAGLSLAYYLSKNNISVEVFEATNHLGGMARTWTWNEFYVDSPTFCIHPSRRFGMTGRLFLATILSSKNFSLLTIFKRDLEYFFDYH